MRGKKPYFVMIVVVLLTIISFFISLNTGYIKIDWLDIFKVLVGAGTEQNQLILIDFRLPRIIIALLIGAGLAISGAILQSITQNELADPSILGIHSGAGLAVVLFIYFLRNTTLSLQPYSIFIMPFVALVGALLAACIIYLLAWKNGLAPARLLLVGIGINAAFGAALIIFQLRMHPNDFMQATVWLSGDIQGTSWTYVVSLLPWIVILIPYVIYKARFLNIFLLGDQVAIGLGINLEQERTKLLFVSVALAGACVAVGGGIAFLGLIVPHLTKALVGSNHHVSLPNMALIGALLLLISDAIARSILAPSEIPVGLVVSCIGAPYFIYLLVRQ
ncbi:FecCD family ABC transporter permease [Amphibacillus cookii]|uniref:FecCD family ABC transporter permease n=1 Tax=Amphibacillus cookii TaxID=767787 RepID=UPI00195CD64C|nr:iron ABC transporter permease [Amphibacillus cookii]MBM7541965.1 iron complex transport system permease protein [Amphibacillus cookii]